jgi:hypothetical protein
MLQERAKQVMYVWHRVCRLSARALPKICSPVLHERLCVGMQGLTTSASALYVRHSVCRHAGAYDQRLRGREGATSAQALYVPRSGM